MSRDDGHVLDIVNAADRTARFVRGVTQDQFLADDMLQSAVLHQLTIVGEACRRFSAEFRALNPSIDWAGIVGLRNRIVHEYDGIDLDQVWEVAQVELPALIPALRAVLPPKPDGED